MAPGSSVRVPARSAAPSRASVGLTGAEALRRLGINGPNEIVRDAPTRTLDVALRQFRSPVVWILMAACLVSALIGEGLNASAIAVILVINAAVGFVQERRAEHAIDALRSMTAPRARVLRDGHRMVVPSRDVVEGDLLVLEAGDIVAADARLVEVHRLSTNEAALTGESAPVYKALDTPPAGAHLAEQRNRVFLGTSVATGSAVAVVEATGMASQLGGIAHLVATAQKADTPLQQRLERVGRVLMFFCAGIVALVAVIGIVRGARLFDVFMTAVSLGVAAVPEGLPAIVTIALAVGVQRMARRHVLVRRLPAVEALGCATVICTDKTGTLTTGVMTVRDLWGPDHHQLLFAAAACCDAELEPGSRTGIGDPTELAILIAADQRGIARGDLERTLPRIALTPFDPDQKRMSVTRANGVTYIKGAIEVIAPFADGDTTDAVLAHGRMAGRGLRVLAVATGRGEAHRNLALLGLIGIADPPRPEAIEAIAAARRAGIATVMITGDHPETARAIAHELGMFCPGERETDLVHARATPEAKLQIVRAWKGRGAVVAMTGDGVNDAPALREADIGIAMGLSGTEVTREASDMVLADDNFASIVAAIREGRAIFDNIRKTLIYLLTGNFAELMVMLVAAVVGLPMPLLPLHLLWINIVTDGPPALALVVDRGRQDVLARPPRHPEEPILGPFEWRRIAGIGIVEAAATLGAFGWVLYSEGLANARSVAFATLVFSQLFRTFAARSATDTVWRVGPLSNVPLLGVIAVSVAVQTAIQLLPLTQQLFSLPAPLMSDWCLALVVGLLPVSVLEMSKLLDGERERLG